MALTKISRGLLSTGISDSSDATAITIDSSENVGIGTTTPADKLEVAGNVLISDSSPELTLETGASHYNWQIAAQENLSSALEISVGSADADASNDTFSPKIYVKQAGDVEITDGNLVVASGHGIDFGATSDVSATSELLDDYEEGIYVATITCSTSGTATLNGAYSDLSYTKIGRLVTVTGLIIVSSVSSPVGYYCINLPFTPASLTDRAGDSAGTIIHHYGVNAGAGQYVVMINESNASLLVYRGDVGTTRSENSAEELRAGTQLNISATYVTA